MSKVWLLVLISFLTGCIAGDFGQERERLYEMNSASEVCNLHPEHCTDSTSK
ncbi:MAG: hypothetical protein IJ689_02290 [Alphaproteobacteria bacterium]|nr:hypothetical protein [Alphaproteobacteria bacterium]